MNFKSEQFISIKLDTSQKFERVYNIEFDKNFNTWLTLNLTTKYFALVKYDGITWRIWKVSEIFNVYSENHFVVAIDSSNIVWFYMTGPGLASFDGNNFELHYSGESPITKWPKMSIDKFKNKWIFGPLSFGLFKVDSIDNYFLYTPSNSPLPSNNGGIIYLDGDSLWICTLKGMVLLHNNNWKIFDTTNTKMPSQQIFSFAKDLNGTRWLGTRNLGLLKWIDDSTFIVYNSSNAPFINNYVNVITVDRYNNLWIGTDNGLLKYDGINFTFIDQTINRIILDVKVDTFNNKWIACDFSPDLDWGLAIYNENGISGINLPTSVYENVLSEKKFILYQNYPNPFNSKTKIKYSISNSGFTSLKIYNLLGQEIATLVNEPKQIGEYETEFVADQFNLSSGVYIYQLKNNSLVQSRKFILIK